MLVNQLLAKRWLVAVAALFIAACSESNNVAEGNEDVSRGPDPLILDVYKSPTCGCCSDWMEHMDKNGFQSVSHNLDDLSDLKAAKGIRPQYQSCHTAVSKEGYVFEGHVPARFIKQFLEQRPDGAIGLAAPGMPMGSPGMEIGDRFTPYDVLLLKADGSAELYARVENQQEQY